MLSLRVLKFGLWRHSCQFWEFSRQRGVFFANIGIFEIEVGNFGKILEFVSLKFLVKPPNFCMEISGVLNKFGCGHF